MNELRIEEVANSLREAGYTVVGVILDLFDPHRAIGLLPDGREVVYRWTEDGPIVGPPR